MPTNSMFPLSDSPAIAYREALTELRPKLLAMPEERVLRTLTIDPATAAATAEATMTKLAPHRAALVEQFGNAAEKVLDELVTIARAARQADIELAATEAPTDVSGHHDAVRKAYHLLITDADALANRGLLDAASLDAARDIQGHRALIRSTLVLVQVLRDRWSMFSGQSPLTLADLDNAESVAQRMATAMSDRDNGVQRLPAADLRARALSALVQTYEELRRMVTFLRWRQGDADTLAPSLWKNRARRSRGTNANGSTPPPPPPVPTDPPVVS